MRLGMCVKVVMAIATVMIGVMPLQAGVKKINAQGKLTDTSGNPITGVHTIYFRLYDSATAGTMKWGPESFGVNLGTDGLFNVVLGSNVSLDALPFNKQYYLGITVDGQLEMTPRQALGASSYSLGSLGDFNAAANITASGSLSVGQNITATGSITVATATANSMNSIKVAFSTASVSNTLSSGKLGIGTANPRTLLDIYTSTNKEGISIGAGISGIESSANIYFYPSSSNANQRNWLISAFYDTYGTFSIRNSTAPYGNPYSAGVTRFLIDKDGKIGIGTFSPLTMLHINTNNPTSAQDIAIFQNAGFRLIFGNYTNGNWYVRSYNTNASRNSILLNPDGGNVGIGTANPAYKLQVAGVINALGTGNGSGDCIIIGNDTKLVDVNIANTVAFYGMQNPTAGATVKAASFPTFSSRRFKKDIQMSTYGLSAILKLNPVSYKYIDDNSNTKRLGFIAEDMCEVIPEVVGKDASNNPDSIDYSHLTAILVKAIQEQQEQIEELRKEINKLKKK